MLEGLTAIGNFLGKSPNTVMRWIKYYGLPCIKTPEGVWLTHKDLIFKWIVAGHQACLKNDGLEVTEEIKDTSYLDASTQDMLKHLREGQLNG